MEELLRILSDMLPHVDFETEDRLMDNRILDSLEIVMLVGDINDAFDVTITAEDLTPKNFNSAEAIYALIERLRDA